jgi:GNAT superfamily N-acetyltransferase
MHILVTETDLDGVRCWRAAYRLEMACQIIHDSIHEREGWSREYLLRTGSVTIGYGSVAVGGPWTETPSVYEVYVAPQHRVHSFDAFAALLDASGATRIEVQSNDVLSTAMLHSFAAEATAEAILFRDGVTTMHAPAGAVFRQATASEFSDVPEDRLRWRGVVEIEGEVAATGGILFHYNPPYGDIFMDVVERFRGRGLGSFVVQELKRICWESGHVPAARCNVTNVASRRTLQKAGLVPCGHILVGSVRRAGEEA